MEVENREKTDKSRVWMILDDTSKWRSESMIGRGDIRLVQWRTENMIQSFELDKLTE